MASCMCLVIRLRACILNQREVRAKQELFMHQDVPDKVSCISVSCWGRGEGEVLKNPGFRGTLAGNQQATNLSD